MHPDTAMIRRARLPAATPLLGLLVLVLLAADRGLAADLEKAYPGGGSFEGGVTSQDASAGDAAPKDADSVSHVAYYEGVLDWLFKWMGRNGVDTSGVKFVVDNSTDHPAWMRPEFGIFAAHNFSKGETIFSVPVSLQVSSTWITNEHHPYGKKAGPADERGWTGYTALATWLLRERAAGSASPWAPFIRLLPPYVPLPVFFPDEILKELQFHSIIEKAQLYRQAMETEYISTTKEVLGESKREDFLWAMSIVISRSFNGPQYVSADGTPLSQFSPAVLLPLGDLLNHHSKFNTGWKHEADGAFTFYAYHDIKAGDQLFSQYGLRGTDSLLMLYGFVQEENDFDSVFLIGAANGTFELYEAYFDNRATDPAVHEWMAYLTQASHNAVRFVAEEEKKAFERKELLVGPKYDFSDNDTLAAWHGAIVDPRLLASLTSVIHYFTFGKEVDYGNVGRLSVWYGWYLYQGTCVEHSGHLKLTPNEASAFVSAAQTIKAYAEYSLKSLPTTLQDDENHIAAMGACKQMMGQKEIEEKASEELKSYCKGVGTESFTETQLVIRARLEKKKVLTALLNRLAETCGEAEVTAAKEMVMSPLTPELGNTETAPGTGEGEGVVIEEVTAGKEGPESKASEEKKEEAVSGKKSKKGWW